MYLENYSIMIITWLAGVTYALHGKNTVHMTRENADQSIDDKLHFYDASSKPAIMDFNGTKYGYVQNLQGDIAQIIDLNGTVL